MWYQWVMHLENERTQQQVVNLIQLTCDESTDQLMICLNTYSTKMTDSYTGQSKVPAMR